MQKYSKELEWSAAPYRATNETADRAPIQGAARSFFTGVLQQVLMMSCEVMLGCVVLGVFFPFLAMKFLKSLVPIRLK